MPARRSSALLAGWLSTWTSLTLIACSGPAAVDEPPTSRLSNDSSVSHGASTLPYRLLAPELKITAGSHVGLVGADSTWIESLAEATGSRGSVIQLELGSEGASEVSLHDILLVESWSRLVRESDTSPDRALRRLGERLIEGGRLWIIEPRRGSGAAARNPGASWLHIVETARLAGFAVRLVDVNRLEDHVLVQVEKRGERVGS